MKPLRIWLVGTRRTRAPGPVTITITITGPGAGPHLAGQGVLNDIIAVAGRRPEGA